MEQNAGRRIGFGVNSNAGVIHPPMAHPCRVRKNEVMDTSSQNIFSVLGGWISPRDGVRNLCVWMEPLLA